MTDWLKQLRNPPAAYRGAPFWAWNGKLEKAELVRQVGEFHRAGFGGFFMHVRYGLETEYLSDEFLDCIKAVVAAAKRRNMEAWLYDEDRWPSGFAGGVATADPKNRIKFLAVEQAPSDQFTGPPADAVRCFVADVQGNTARDVQPLPLGEKPPTGRTVLIYRARVAGDVGWFNNTAYLDTMNPQAVRGFIEATHEVYKRAIGAEFGKTIPGIFTDEPNYGHFRSWGGPEQLCLPWTGRLTAEFRRRCGYDLLDHLVQLSHDVAGLPSQNARHDYRRVATELYTEAFTAQIGQWCAANNLELTGHELSEESLPSQIDQAGACMPHYEHYQRPGIDILMERAPEVLTSKQCVSVASQLGRPRVLSELYGCTGWDSTFEMYKHIGDWHQVLGLNSFCPHLSWYTMAGGAKRDYPAGIFYQSPWWADHKVLADYFARLSLALSQGTSCRRVAVIHPIESAWLVHLKQDRTRSAGLSESLERLCVDLLDNQFDFDFADESMLPRHGGVEAAGGDQPAMFRVGQCAYRAVVVPESLTLRASTVELLERFADAGGKVVFVGEPPTLVDCQPSDRLAALLARSCRVAVGPTGLAAALGEDCRPVRVTSVHRIDRAVAAWVHLRDTEQGQVLFVHHRDRAKANAVTIRWAGRGRIREIDPMTGKLTDVPGVESADGTQRFITTLEATGSRLYLRTAEMPRLLVCPPARMRVGQVNFGPLWDYALDEPNGLNLDYCRVRLVDKDTDWRPRKLVWQQQRDIRKELGFRDSSTPAEQPYIWLRNASARVGRLEVEFDVPVEAAPVGTVGLVIEHPERFEIAVNGKVVKPLDPNEPEAPLSAKDVAWFIDRSFRVVPLKGVKWVKGVNTIRLTTDYREHHWLEEVYLIGRFGVRASGDRAVVTALPKKLAVGDWTGQGLAMYSGSVTYRQSVRVGKLARGQRVVLCLERPKATLVRVAVNGKPAGLLPWQPWRLDVTELVRPGALNRFEITLVSSRRNLLGPLHHAQANPLWTGPTEFRTEGELDGRPDYNLVPYGLLGEAYLAIKQ